MLSDKGFRCRQESMKKNRLYQPIICLIIALFFAYAPAHADHNQRGELVGVSPEIPFPDWLTVSFLEIMEDAEDAATEDKHVMLFFHMNGCPYCYKMAVENFIDSPHVDFIRHNFNVIELNWDGSREVVFNESVSLPEKELARHLGARATPTTIFLNESGSPIFRIDGYRDPDTFKVMLDYVKGKHYLSTSFQSYQTSLEKSVVYEMSSSDSIISASDINLSQIADQPIMLLFESHYCTTCEDFHNNTLALAKSEKLLENYTIIRVNTQSDATMIDFAGKLVSQKDFTEQQKMTTYEPGVLLYNEAKIRRRIDHKLFNFHFLEGLRWVQSKAYQSEPDFYGYIDRITAERLEKGENVNIVN